MKENIPLCPGWPTAFPPWLASFSAAPRASSLALPFAPSPLISSLTGRFSLGFNISHSLKPQISDEVYQTVPVGQQIFTK